MINTHKVFVKTNTDSNITAVNSSAFVDDGWGVQIDEGIGDKHHHAQNNYFDKPIITGGGAYRYRLVNGAPVEKTDAEIVAEEAALAANTPIDALTQVQFAIAELAEAQAADQTATELALTELAELMMGGVI